MRYRSPLPLLALVSLLGCNGSAGTVRTIAEWVDALHELDMPRLAAVDANAPRGALSGPEWDAWVARVSRVASSYEVQRDRGAIEVDPDGYVIPLATRMGRGTYWELSGLERAGAVTSVELKLNFGYGEVAYGQLPRGTEVYLLTKPLGRVTPIVLGRGRAHAMSVLEHLTVGVELAPAGEGGGLGVKRVMWDPGHAVFRRVEWVF